MKDLKLGVPYKDGYVEAEMQDKSIAFDLDNVIFCHKFILKDQNQ